MSKSYKNQNQINIFKNISIKFALNFFKSVIFQILRIFNGLFQTKSVKKYILSNYNIKRTINLCKRKMEKLLNSIKKIPYVQVKISS